MKNHAPHNPTLNDRMRLIAGTRDEKQQRPRYTGPVQHREEDSDENNARPEIGLEHDDCPRNYDYERGLPEIEERARRFPAPRQNLGKHQHYGDFRDLGRLADAMASNGEPALGARGGARAFPDDERESKKKNRERVKGDGHPLDEADRRTHYRVGETHSDEQPHDLRLVGVGDGCRRIGLACGVNHRDTE